MWKLRGLLKTSEGELLSPSRFLFVSVLREVLLTMSRIVWNPVIVSARDGLIKAPAKMRSGAHCPGLPTVDYFTTSPGDSRSFPQHALPMLSYKWRWPAATECDRQWRQLLKGAVLVLALSALPAVSCSATHKQIKERVRT